MYYFNVTKIVTTKESKQKKLIKKYKYNLIKAFAIQNL
mgnify:CR=1 FL=1|jgi:hypothetical protein